MEDLPSPGALAPRGPAGGASGGLTVLSVASPFTALGTDNDGPAEQVVAAIDAALLRAGHRSLVLAPEGSAVAGTLLPLPRVHAAAQGTAPTEAARTAVLRRVAAMVADAVERHAVDLVHLHVHDFTALLPPPGVPVLVTLYEPLDRYPDGVLAPRRPHTHLQGVSAEQTRAAPPGIALLPPIEVGVPVDRLHIRVPKRRFAVCLGTIERDHGFHIALDAAREVDIQLLLGGELSRSPDEQRYLQEEIRPRLDTKRRFLGQIGFARKRWMLGAARCLLAPSLTPDPTAMAALEALACGTPVVAFPTGALADIVEPGVTGFLVEDAASMARAIEDCETIDPDACRAVARARYSLEVMSDRYLTLYDDLVAGRARSVGVA
ncbi:glycosyltransferase [Azospirillum rugosum]|uniref:Glycosyltransferase involved in cell wall biosynthesis n=1 Tax=Azospirillum rugosum TaxID=416170 RepID=A0ABS4SNU1_9PROT|nr:glycosyltransferase [Azospirillum rugosum]MBP2294223.1 glycosyltransferase involved in cell wall biosynthesis [Azospirillum rugosum]MDQ0527388.1 glycosyltransferase involved in cell wall biosynthesis [Azospirillum rugosum]